MAEENKSSAPERTIKIDGVDYTADQLSETARSQVINLRFTDQEIERLERQLAICRTARAAYAQALKGQLAEAKKPAH